MLTVSVESKSAGAHEKTLESGNYQITITWTTINDAALTAGSYWGSELSEFSAGQVDGNTVTFTAYKGLSQVTIVVTWDTDNNEPISFTMS